MQEKQRLLVGTLNANFTCSSFRCLEVYASTSVLVHCKACKEEKNRKILKIRCCEIKSDDQLDMPLDLLISHIFIILLGNIASYLHY